jgi:hypothetical protein
VAIARKGQRNIVVGDVAYRWSATGGDDGISLVVWPRDHAGHRITATFDYDQRRRPVAGVPGAFSLHEQIVITPRIVRRVIELAIARGYDPGAAEGGQLDLGPADALVDLTDVIRGR